MPNNAQNLESSFDKNAQSVKPPQSEASLENKRSGASVAQQVSLENKGYRLGCADVSLEVDCHAATNAAARNDDKTAKSVEKSHDKKAERVFDSHAAGGRIFDEKAGLCSLLCGDKPVMAIAQTKGKLPAFSQKANAKNVSEPAKDSRIVDEKSGLFKDSQGRALGVRNRPEQPEIADLSLQAESTSKKPTPSPSDSKILELESGLFEPRKEIRLGGLSTQCGDEIHDSSPKAESPIAIAFLSVLYSGRSPKAPGTAGSALSVLLGLPILLYSAQTLFLLACLLGIIAVREIDKWEAYSGKHDEKWIVIDELVGVWLAMSILCYGNPSLWLTIDKSAGIWLIISTLWHEGHFVHIMLAFVLFRVFDIWKPSIIGRVDRKLKGGLGVVLDDVLAGLVAGVFSLVVLAILSRFGVDLSLW